MDLLEFCDSAFWYGRYSEQIYEGKIHSSDSCRIFRWLHLRTLYTYNDWTGSKYEDKRIFLGKRCVHTTNFSIRTSEIPSGNGSKLGNSHWVHGMEFSHKRLFDFATRNEFPEIVLIRTFIDLLIHKQYMEAVIVCIKRSFSRKNRTIRRNRKFPKLSDFPSTHFLIIFCYPDFVTITCAFVLLLWIYSISQR